MNWCHIWVLMYLLAQGNRGSGGPKEREHSAECADGADGADGAD